MALVVKDRVQVTTSTTGTGTLTLGSAVTGFQDFSVIGNGNTTYYAITSNGAWEVGIGTYTSAGTTLSRDTVLASSSSGSKISLTGTSNVFVTYPADKSVDIETAQTITNKSMSGSSNTFTNLPNSALTNSSITINGSAISLGGSTSVGTITSVTGTSPISSSGGNTPAISIAQATTSTNGYLSSTDWNTFNNKVSSQWTTSSSNIYYTNGNVAVGTTDYGVNDAVGSERPLIVSGSDSSTTISGSKAALVIANANTTTNNTAQLSFAAKTGVSGTQFTSATISCVFGARTNGQYPTGQIVFSTSSALNNAPSEKFRIDNVGNFTAVIPSGSTSYPAYFARAWVNFNGTGTVAIRASGNVSSITDNGTGDYTVNFTNAMPDANYNVIGSSGQRQAGVGMDIVGRNLDNSLQTTSAVRIYNLYTNNSTTDNPNISVAVFR